MDFTWSDEEERLYQRTMADVRERLGHRVRGQAEQPFDRDDWIRCAASGLLGPCVPTDYGGRGLSFLATTRVMEAFGRGCEDMGMVFGVGAHLFACCLPVAEYGTELLKRRALPKLCRGEWVGANAITEAEAGSDAFSLSTTSVRDGEDYVLNGEKSWVTNGPLADLLVVYARTSAADGFFGITAFAVERVAHGVSAGPPIDKMGLRSTSASRVAFHDCRVPAAHRLGEEGQGAVIFGRSMEWERTGLLAGYIGQMQRQLDRTVEHAVRRRQFDRSISKNQAVSHRIARMKLRLEAARLLVQRAAWLLDRGCASVLESCLAKLATSEAAVQSGLDAVQVFGGAGFTTEAGVERMLRDSVGSTIASGTSDILLEIVAGELGL